MAGQPLLVIAGPTASGKTALAVELAGIYNGEVICADSRTIYKSMDIGTAKPSVSEQAGIPHWGLNLVEPGERYTAADFQSFAREKIADIQARGKLPIVTGGTGLYINAVIYDYNFDVAYDSLLREKLAGMSMEDLISYSKDNNIDIKDDEQNKRRIIRLIERGGITKKSDRLIDLNTFVVGIATNKSTLDIRIANRAEQIFEYGVVEETKKLGDKYSWDLEAMSSNIYPIVRRYLNGEVDATTAKQLFVISDRQLAKRQMTWFRKDPNILWGGQTDIMNYLSTRL